MNLRNLLSSVFLGKTQKRFSAAEEAIILGAGFAGGSHSHLIRANTPTNALRNSVVYDAIRLLVETPSTLPLRLVDRKTKLEVSNHPISALLHEPNEEQTIIEFLEAMAANYFMLGNAYAEKVIERGRITALWPICASHVTTVRKDGRLLYEYNTPGGKAVVLSDLNVIPLRMFGLSELGGISPIWAAEKAINLSLTQEEMATQNYADGSRPDYVISLPPEKVLEQLEAIDADSLKADKATIQGMIEGAKTRRGMYIPFGYSLQAAPAANFEQSQFSEGRSFQVRELARIFDLPLSMLGEGEKPTEEDRLKFYETIRRFITKFEKRLERDLLSPADRQKYQLKFMMQALLRANSQAQTDRYVRLWQIGQYTNNQIAEFEDEPISDDPRANEKHYPVNMTSENIAGTVQGTNPADGGVPARSLQAETRAETEAKQVEKRVQKPLSDVQTRSLSGRKSAATRAKPLFKAAVERIVRKEKAMVLKDAKSILGNRAADNLEDRLREVYKGELRSFIQDQVSKPVEVLFEEIVKTMRAELGNEFDEGELKTIVSRYQEIWLRDYIDSSLGQLIGIIKKAENSADILGELETRFDEWENGRTDESPSRSEKESEQESSKGMNVFARAIYGLAGVKTLRWIVSDPCEFCDPYTDFEFNINADITTPPLHRSCFCSITSG